MIKKLKGKIKKGKGIILKGKQFNLKFPFKILIFTFLWRR